MTKNACPHCGATPYSLEKKEVIQTRCDQCNGLIVASEEALGAMQTPKENRTGEEQTPAKDDAVR